MRIWLNKKKSRFCFVCSSVKKKKSSSSLHLRRNWCCLRKLNFLGTRFISRKMKKKRSSLIEIWFAKKRTCSICVKHLRLHLWIALNRESDVFIRIPLFNIDKHFISMFCASLLFRSLNWCFGWRMSMKFGRICLMCFSAYVSLFG